MCIEIARTNFWVPKESTVCYSFGAVIMKLGFLFNSIDQITVGIRY